jgi:hypothetical protein
MPNANRKNFRFLECRRRKLDALADSIPIRTSIDGKVVDLFREVAAAMKKSRPAVRQNTGKVAGRKRTA